MEWRSTFATPLTTSVGTAVAAGAAVLGVRAQQNTEPHAAGPNIVQTKFLMWILRAMNRDHGSALPPHRDPGLDSPLLRR